MPNHPTTQPLSKCPFCGVAGTTKSGEHAYPAWTAECVPGHDHPGQAGVTMTRELDGQAPQIWQTPELSVKTKRVCKACNEGWMSKLETRVMPLLCPLIAGEAGEVRGRDQHILAWWAAKTDAMLDRTQSPPHIPDRAHAAIKVDRCPHRGVLGVWMGAYTGEPAGREGGWKLIRDALTFNVIGDKGIHGYCHTFRVGHVWFQIAGTILDRRYGFGPVFSPANLLQIWPHTGHTVAWPSEVASLGEQEFAECAHRFSPNRLGAGSVTPAPPPAAGPGSSIAAAD